MDDETLKEIIKCQLEDHGIPFQENHFNIAKEYYEQHQEIIPIDEFLAKAIIIDPFVELTRAMMNDRDQEQTDDESTNNSDSDNSEFDEDDAPDKINDDDDEMPELDSEFVSDLPSTHILTAIREGNSHSVRILPVLNPVIGQMSFNLPFGFLSSIFPELNEEALDELKDVKMVLSSSEVEKLRLIFVKNPNEMGEKNQCLNCYDEFVVSDLVRMLPCEHLFHRLCIDDQLKTVSHLCPVCKQSTGEYEYLNK